MNAQMKKVVVEIAPDGSTKIDAQGFVGGSCAVATRELEVLLAGSGGSVDDKKKPDFYVKTGSAQSLKG